MAKDFVLPSAARIPGVAEDWLVRFFGTTGLVRIGSPDVLPLLEELQNDAHPWVREEAIRALRRLTQGAFPIGCPSAPRA